MPDDLDALRRDVATLRWFHTIDLGDGIVTPGEDESPRKLGWLHLPDDLSGKSVLDVGAWDGFFSFAAERRGAERVVAVDPACWRPPAWGPDGWGTRQGFDLARRALDSAVETADVDLEALSPDTVGTFDLVLFLGVFYHLPDPWPIFHAVSRVCAGQLVLETHADLIGLRRPAMAYYPGTELAGDPSNWWGPNPALLRAALRNAGFARVEIVHAESLAYRVARAATRRLRGRSRMRIAQGRVVLHAFR